MFENKLRRVNDYRNSAGQYGTVTANEEYCKTINSDLRYSPRINVKLLEKRLDYQTREKSLKQKKLKTSSLN